MQKNLSTTDLHISNNRSSYDIEAEVSLLCKLKTQVPQTTAFGNSNHSALAAQIDVLQGQLSHEAVRDRYEIDGVDQYVLVCALFAAEWLYENELAPSEDWLIMLYPDQCSRFVN
jgi:hypothetical protein